MRGERASRERVCEYTLSQLATGVNTMRACPLLAIQRGSQVPSTSPNPHLLEFTASEGVRAT